MKCTHTHTIKFNRLHYKDDVCTTYRIVFGFKLWAFFVHEHCLDRKKTYIVTLVTTVTIAIVTSVLPQYCTTGFLHLVSKTGFLTARTGLTTCQFTVTNSLMTCFGSCKTGIIAIM